MSKISLFVYALLAVVTFAHISWAKPASDGYSSKYDSFDVQGVLASKRLVKKYGDCLMERGPCPPEGRFLKGEIFYKFIFVVFQAVYYLIILDFVFLLEYISCFSIKFGQRSMQNIM